MATFRSYVVTDMVFGGMPAGYVVEASSYRITVVNGPTSSTISGYGFTYAGNYVTSGTVTDIVSRVDGFVATEMHGLSAYAPTVINEIAFGDSVGLFSLLLTGDDEIYGSDYNDILAGYEGDDILVGGAGDDEIYGGEGFDAAIFSGSFNDYVIEWKGLNVFQITDIRFANGYEGSDQVGGIEAFAFESGEIVLAADLMPPAPWYQQSGNVEIVAATYQFFVGSIPNSGGFAYLINSPHNPADLSDPYYAAFNVENRYINFASNLGTEGEGKSFFDAAFGSLSFEQTVMLAYEEIMGKELTGGAYNFFMGAHGFYEDVAEQRVVRPGVDLDDATKIVAIGSILNEAVKSGQGPYADAIDDLTADVYSDGQSVMLGSDMFTYV